MTKSNEMGGGNAVFVSCPGKTHIIVKDLFFPIFNTI